LVVRKTRLIPAGFFMARRTARVLGRNCPSCVFLRVLACSCALSFFRQFQYCLAIRSGLQAEGRATPYRRPTRHFAFRAAAQPLQSIIEKIFD
jgi:hypothetical protein